MAERCVTLEINRRPVLALTATSLLSAWAREEEPWFIEELGRMRSNGLAILRPGDERLVRPARPEEIAALELQHALDAARGEDASTASRSGLSLASLWLEDLAVHISRRDRLPECAGRLLRSSPVRRS